jgi:hypothetical protein
VPTTEVRTRSYGRASLLLCALILCQRLAIGQTSASLDCDYRVKAGEPFKVRVKLDQAPNVEGIPLIVFIEGPERAQLAGSLMMKPGTDTYEVPITIPPTAVGGTWSVIQVRVSPSGRSENMLPHTNCAFQIIPIPGLVLPTRADVAVSASQSQLLRREAIQLQARIQQVKSKVFEYEAGNHRGTLTPLLRTALIDSVSALRVTQDEFLKLGTTKEQRPNAEVFFSDLGQSYQAAISQMSHSASAATQQGRLIRVSDDKKRAEPLVALALRPMEQNELAYKVVADEGSLVFDLEVDSTPEGAAVTYFRKGDQPRANPDPTRSTIHSLPYTIWIVHMEKPGYRPEDREHDPFREPNHVIHVDLQK